MLKKIQLIAFVCLSSFTNSQTIHTTINSSILGETRALKIQLPRNYDTNSDKTYPVIIVLDGDYLFEPMAGNVDYYSYWNEIPEAIVVGINQTGTRMEDCFYDKQHFLPAKSGADFFEFLGMELLAFIDKSYRTAKFVVLAGHDHTANFINYYLFKEEPLFAAYINISPDLAPEMANRLVQALGTVQTQKWFYLATASQDLPNLKKNILKLHQKLSSIENENLHYAFNNFDGATHYTMVGRAIPNALERIFSSYRPITQKEYDTKIVNSKGSAYDYLLKKYETIKNYFGLEIPIRTNDFLAIGKALELNQNWRDLEKLGKLAQDEYPNSMLGIYYLARSYEGEGKPKKAMRTYEKGYGMEEVAYLTVDFMLGKAEAIKEDFGY